jgi:Coenzyme PQQ synthesis protein D (PqqD)
VRSLRIKIDKDVIVYEENNEIILINMVRNKFYALDEFSSYVWRKIEELKEFSLLVDNLCIKYQESYSVIEKDMKEFVDQLEKVGVIKIHG